jgi:pectate lyase
MKNAVRILAAFMALFSASCGGGGSGGGGGDSGTLNGVSITVSAASIDADGSASLTAVPSVSGDPSVSYTWAITSGGEYAELSATSGKNVSLTGKNTTTEDKSVTVKVTAKAGSVTKTSTTSVVVKAPGESVSLNSVTISGTTEIEAAAEGTLTVTPHYTGSLDTSEISYTWTITSGSTYASITGNGATATITGTNTDSSAHEVTVKVSAVYGTTTKEETCTVSVAAVGTHIVNALTGLTLEASASSVAPDGTVVLTPTATYTGSLNESDFTVSNWEITSGSDYASLKVPSTGAARSAVVFTGDNTSILQAANTTTSSKSVTASVKVSYDGVEETASCTVTIQPAKVTSVAISGTTSLDACDGSTTLTANVSKNGNPASVSYSWEITEGSDYAEISAGASTAAATITGTNTTSSVHTVTVKVTVSDGTNSVSNTVQVSVEKDYSALPAYFPESGETAAYADTYLELYFSSIPVINRAATGTVRIYKSNGTLVDTIKPAAETMYGYGYSGNSGLGTINVQHQLIQVIGNTVRIIPHHNTSTGLTLLENSTSYYVLIDDGIISGTLRGSAFAGITDSGEWTFTTGSAPSPSNNTLTVGEGKQFITVQGALSYLMKNSKTGDWTVKIEPGTYYERIFYAGSANITMSGQGSATYGTDVEIQWCNQDGGDPAKVTNTLWNYGSRGRNVFYYRGGDLVLENISIINTAARKSNEYGEYDSTATSDNANGNNQAEALMFDSTGNCAAYNCNFKSKQDTIYLSPSGGKAWFYGCKIAGDVDFIWGLSDVALFEQCNIISAYDSDKSSNHETYIVAPKLATGTAPYGKGFVLYNCDITTESGQTTYLARSPWGSSGNISQVAIIDTDVTGGLAANPWKGDHVGGDDETVLGWKYYNVTSDGSAISSGNAISASQYAAEFAGRNNIINRTYDGSAFSKAASTWDVNALAQTMGWNVVTDNSKATLDGESEITTVTYDFSKIDPTSTDGLTASSISWNQSLYASGGTGGSLSFDVTGACTVSVYYCYSASGTIKAGSQDAASFSTNSGSTSQIDSTDYEVTAAGMVTVALTGTSYLKKIVVTYTSSGASSGGEETEVTVTYFPSSASSFSAAGTSSDTGIVTAANVAALTETGGTLTTAFGTVNGVSGHYYSTGSVTGNSGDTILTLTLSLTAVEDFTIKSVTGSLNESATGNISRTLTVGSNAALSLGSGKEITLNKTGINYAVSAGSTVNLVFTTSSTADYSNKTFKQLFKDIVITVSTTAEGNGSGGSGGNSSSNKISLSDTPTGYAGYGSPAYYTGSNVVTIDATGGTTDALITQFKNAAKAGSKVIYIKGMLDITYSSTFGGSMIPSAWNVENTALNAFIASKYNSSTMTDVEGAVTSWLDWIKTYGAFNSISSEYNSSAAKTATNLDRYQYELYTAWKSQIQVTLASNTTIIGLTENSGIRGANLSISGVNNIILRNLHLQDAFDPFPHHEVKSDGVTSDGWNSEYDCITIQNTNSYIWIDHCTFEDTVSVGWTSFPGVKTGDASAEVIAYPCNSTGTATTDGYEMWQTYDGLCDIKGSTSNVTVSYCVFRNHDKCMLIGNSDSESVTAASRTITLHHNYYCGAVQRLPMARLSYIHNFNNYYGVPSTSNGYDQKAAVNARYGVYINSEYNYFDSGLKYSYNSSDSTANLYYYGDAGAKKDATSLSSLTYTTTEGAYVFDIPYSYSDYLDEADGLKTLLEANAGAGVWSVEE